MSRKTLQKRGDGHKFYEALSAAIRRLRDKHSITQEELARRVKLSRISIVNLEAGRQRILAHDLVTFAVALNTTPEQLLKMTVREA